MAGAGACGGCDRGAERDGLGPAVRKALLGPLEAALVLGLAPFGLPELLLSAETVLRLFAHSLRISVPPE
jgi:hypothetical protein